MSVAGQQADSARVDRALDRLAEHCDLFVRRAAQVECRRASVRARLEQELGPELASMLLNGLTTTTAA